VIAVSLRDGHSVAPLTDWVRAQLDSWLEGSLESIDPGPPAPHVHRHEHTH
jgi:hypothetical protein